MSGLRKPWAGGSILVLAAVLALSASPAPAGEPTGESHRPARAVGQGGGDAAQGARPFVDPPPFGYTPGQMSAYLDLEGTGEGETVATVVAYHYPTLRDDLNFFSAASDLPLTCDSPSADPARCIDLRVISEPSTPGASQQTIEAWAFESALDVQWLHAIAPDADIVVVEAADDELPTLMRAIRTAIRAGATVVSASWGDFESRGQRKFANVCQTRSALCVAAAGNGGRGDAYPAAERSVLAVGGTVLLLSPAGDYIQDETAWYASGGWVSMFERRPPYQDGLHDQPGRAYPDVAYHADNTRPYAVYYSYGFTGSDGTHYVGGWYLAAGTSSAAPQWAGIIAAANELRVRDGKERLSGRGFTAHRALYALQGSPVLFDVTEGSNGDCGEQCTAAPGWDFVSGAGSPRTGIDLALAAQP